ncbi:MAG: hypothetical protein ACTSUE_04765 [Promethearchaeota archaeon]
MLGKEQNTEELVSKIKEFQEAIAKSIGGDYSEEKVLDLLEKCLNPDFMAGFTAKQTLKQMGTKILRILIKILLTEKRVPAIIVILETIGSLGEDGNVAVPILIHLIEESKNDRIRSISIGVLNNIIKDHEDIIPILVMALKKDPSPDVQRNAKSCLIRRSNEKGFQNIEALIEEHYPKADYPQDFLASSAVPTLVGRFIQKGNKLFGDGKVAIENLMKAERYFRWAMDLNPGPLEGWIYPRLLFIYDALGFERPRSN